MRGSVRETSVSEQRQVVEFCCRAESDLVTLLELSNRACGHFLKDIAFDKLDLPMALNIHVRCFREIELLHLSGFKNTSE
jgi:hypothetical protein